MSIFRNYSIQTGHLGADPETRIAGDHKVTTFDLATTKRWTDKQSGEKKESTFWRRYEAWGKTGENIQTRMKKGELMQVISEPSNNDYEKDGVKLYTEAHRVAEWFDFSGKSKEVGNTDDSNDTPN